MGRNQFKLIYKLIFILLMLPLYFPYDNGHAQEWEDLIIRLFWNHDASRLAVAYASGQLEIYDGNSLDLLYTDDTQRYRMGGLNWLPDNESLAFFQVDPITYLYSIAILNTRTHEAQTLLEIPTDFDISGIAWHPNGTLLALAIRRGDGQDSIGDVQLWDIASSPPQLKQTYPSVRSVIEWSADGTQLFLADSPLYIIDGQTFEYIDSFDYSAWALDWSPDGSLIAVRNDTGTHIWDATTLAPLKTFSHSEHYLSVRWSPDSQTLVAKNHNDQFEFWDIASGQLYAALEGEGFNTLAWHPDGTRIAHSVNYTDFVVVDAPTFNPATE